MHRIKKQWIFNHDRSFWEVNQDLGLISKAHNFFPYCVIHYSVIQFVRKLQISMKPLVLEAPTASFEPIPSSSISEFQIPLSHFCPRWHGSKVFKGSLRRSKAVPTRVFQNILRLGRSMSPVPSQRVSKLESVLTGAQANDRTSKPDHAVTARLNSSHSSPTTRRLQHAGRPTVHGRSTNYFNKQTNRCAIK